MKTLIIAILFTLTFMNCKKVVEIKPKTNLSLTNILNQAKVIDSLPNQLIDTYKGKK
ncbi:hypothetical protein [Empedobacter tilapiae]|uniref:hypothetical protein n=1 Tax=Empedobacter tilapiae TaxID=2491114 RepID=UPI0014572C13|nr:hypothetical protein [Empedobacter tilapiae]